MRDWTLYADDILNACDNIEKYIADLSYESFIKDSRTRDATTHNLMIIGEAVKKIPTSILDDYTDVDWRKIAGLRDVIAHSYFQIKPNILWNILISKIQPLKEIVTIMLDDRGDD
jgi:uncharacterized protein with HEPN domain